MKLTMDILIAKNACKDGLDWYKENGCDTVEGTIEKVLQTDVTERFEWSVWLISRMIDRKRCCRFAIYSAELALPIFEGKFPDDKRPRIAVEATKRFLVGETTHKELNAAYTAAAAAYTAAGAADAAGAAAAYAAAAACAAAACSAAYADAAAYADDAAACAAAAYAAYVKEATYLKIVYHGLELIKEMEVI